MQIENFRTVKDCTVRFGDYTCLVGPNGAGKSTILMALNVFFRYSGESSTNLLALDVEDFHNRNTSEPIRITAAFTDLEAPAQTDFAKLLSAGKTHNHCRGSVEQ